VPHSHLEMMQAALVIAAAEEAEELRQQEGDRQQRVRGAHSALQGLEVALTQANAANLDHATYHRCSPSFSSFALECNRLI
jgi:hypothetical protein